MGEQLQMSPHLGCAALRRIGPGAGRGVRLFFDRRRQRDDGAPNGRLSVWRNPRLLLDRSVEIPPAVIVCTILACGMALMGTWVGHRIEDGILHRAAGETVLHMEHLIQPLIQELAHEEALSEDAQDSLSRLLAGGSLGQDVAVIKIWSPRGTIVYSNRPEFIGRSYPLFDHLQQALKGHIVAEFDDLDEEGNEFERSLDLDLLEVYTPIRESGTNRIIAIGEFYENRPNLKIASRNVRVQAYTVAGSLGVAMLGLLAWLMNSQKRKFLERRVTELSRLLSDNRQLQSRLRSGHARMVEINELFLRRVSADLHDAPAQLLGFALLRLDSLRPRRQPVATGDGAVIEYDETPRPGEFETVRRALAEALDEIRNISAGLAAPELTDLTLSEALELAARRHAERTGTVVARDLSLLRDIPDPSLKICLYRFVQEGLNNAFRHADGCGQTIQARDDGGILEVSVLDSGSSRGSNASPSTNSMNLGLMGLRGRVESLGGVMEFASRPGQGARLTARFNLVDAEYRYA